MEDFKKFIGSVVASFLMLFMFCFCVLILWGLAEAIAWIGRQ